MLACTVWPPTMRPLVIIHRKFVSHVWEPWAESRGVTMQQSWKPTWGVSIQQQLPYHQPMTARGIAHFKTWHPIEIDVEHQHGKPVAEKRTVNIEHTSGFLFVILLPLRKILDSCRRRVVDCCMSWGMATSYPILPRANAHSPIA